MFDVRLAVQFKAYCTDKGIKVTASRSIRLPIPPTAGMFISLPQEDGLPLGPSAVVNTVGVNLDGAVVVGCEAADVKTGMTADEYTKALSENGWGD